MNKEFQRSEEEMMRKRYYDSRVCPECLLPRDFDQGSRRALSVNIKCKRCGAEFIICPQTRHIERIE